MIIYDIEIFKYDFFLTAHVLPEQKYIYIHNSLQEIRDLYSEHMDDMWVGYNNHHYDDIIFKIMITNNVTFEELKKISDEIVEDKFGDRNVKLRYKTNSTPLNSLDLMSSGARMSLKEFEGYAGISIEESEIDFDIDRPLTDDEVKKVFRYNQHDVDATLTSFLLQLPKIESKLTLLKEYNLNKSNIGLTDQSLCGVILGAKRQSHNDGLQPYPKELNIAPVDIIKYKEAPDFFTNMKEIDYSTSHTINIAGVEHVLAFGGLHGAIPNYHYKGEMWMVDVGSYYPNMMLNFNLCPRGASKEAFQSLVDKRMNAKNNVIIYQNLYNKDGEKKENYKQLINGNKKLSNALKLPINAVSGAMKAKFSDLFDEHHNNMMCISGQLLLIDLIEHLEPHMTLIQSNTDGILIIPHDKVACEREIEKWEEKTGLELEKTVATEIYQKDVNNYILVTEQGVKCKGGYVGQYHNEEGKYLTSMRRVLDIVDDAIVDFLVYGVPLEQTICNDSNASVKYQMIKKLGTMYKDIAWVNYNNDGEETLVHGIQRINRVFASKNNTHGKLVKMHEKKDTYDSVEGLPDRCMVVNKDISNLTISEIENVDYDWYINVAKDRIIDFILSDDDKKNIKLEIKQLQQNQVEKNKKAKEESAVKIKDLRDIYKLKIKANPDKKDELKDELNNKIETIKRKQKEAADQALSSVKEGLKTQEFKKQWDKVLSIVK